MVEYRADAEAPVMASARIAAIVSVRAIRLVLPGDVEMLCLRRVWTFYHKISFTSHCFEVENRLTDGHAE